MKVLAMWVGGFLFGYVSCVAVPHDGPFLGGLACGVLVTLIGAIRTDGCRVLVLIPLAPLLGLLGMGLMAPVTFLPWRLVGCVQPAVQTMLFLELMLLTLSGGVNLFTLLGLVGIGVGIALWACELWMPELGWGMRLAGAAVAVLYTVLLSVAVSFAKGFLARRAARAVKPPPPLPANPARSLRVLAGRLQNTELHRLAEEVVRPCADSYDRRPAYDRENHEAELLAKIDQYAAADEIHPAVQAFLLALRAEMADVRAGRDSWRTAEARQRVTPEMLGELGLL